MAAGTRTSEGRSQFGTFKGYGRRAAGDVKPRVEKLFNPYADD
jgi:hypothetical protein